MADPVISVIVPVYKAEKFLNKCIKSILSQSYRSLDIILVDDGSPDRCPQICDKFALKDSRIRVIHKENGGVSSARNMGIKAAFGEYICFVDADDWLPSNSIETLLQYAGEDIDLVRGTHTVVGIFGKAHLSGIENPKIDVRSMRSLYDFVYDVSLGPVAKLYKSSIIKKNTLWFDVDVKLGEDAIFNYRYLRCCRWVASTNQSVYYYNRVVGNTASIKGYSEFNLWLPIFIEEYKKLFRIEDDNICKEAITEKAWRDFECACGNHLMLGDSEVCQQETKKSFEILKSILLENELIDLGFNSKEYRYISRRKQEILPFLEKEDFAGLYNYMLRNMHDSQRKVRNFCCRIASRFLFLR